MHKSQGLGGAGRKQAAWRQRWPLLLGKLELVHQAKEQAHLLARLSAPQQPCVLAFANAHALNLAAHDREFFEALLDVDLLLRDGAGMAALLALLGVPAGRNLNGTDLIPQLMRRFNGRPVALFGTQDPFLQRALDVTQAELAPCSSWQHAHGFHAVPHYLRLAQAQHSALIVLGMGMPRQEEVALALRAQLRHPCLIVCGGAILDFLGGKTARAPAWMRDSGLEWAYRLACEPKRLFRRYVLGNPLFMWRALRLKYLAWRGLA